MSKATYDTETFKSIMTKAISEGVSLQPTALQKSHFPLISKQALHNRIMGFVENNPEYKYFFLSPRRKAHQLFWEGKSVHQVMSLLNLSQAQAYRYKKEIREVLK